MITNKNSPPMEGCPQGRGGSKRNTKNYNNLPYNPKLKEFAKELRKSGNLSEVLLWQQIKNGQFNGLDFDRQKIIGNFIVDFYCANNNVVIEIDGSSHDTKVEYDAQRDAYLCGLRLRVIHLDDAAVKRNLAGVMTMLRNHPVFIGACGGNNHPATCGGPPPMEGGMIRLTQGRSSTLRIYCSNITKE